MDAVGVEQAIAVGYSMGGAVAQLLWRRHPHMVSGLALCASAMKFRQTVAEYRDFALIRLACRPASLLPETDGTWQNGWRRPGPAGHRWLIRSSTTGRRARSGPVISVQILAAGVALGGFDSSAWVGDIDVPTTVLIGVDDSVVPTARQRQLATALPRPLVVEFSGDHAAPVVRPDHFARQLTAGISWLHRG